MRMKQQFEAYMDDYNIINAYMSKNLFGGKSNKFYLKDSKGNMTLLSLVETSTSATSIYTKYKLKSEQDFIVGEEYLLFEEHCRSTIVHCGHIVKTDRFYDSYTDTISDLGCSYTPEESTFRIWSPVASAAYLIFHGTEDHLHTMKRGKLGIFSVTVPGDCLNVRYTYILRIDGEYKEISDPFSPFSGPNGKYSVVDSMDLIKAPQTYPLPKMNSNCDAIIYETSIRDMTSQPGIGVKNPKTFTGFVEENDITREKNTGFTYLKSLGITHIQLMPVFDFGSVDEENVNIYYNWGYDPVQYRVLEGSYSTNPRNHRTRIEEFIKMIEKIHKAGLRVNLDLVFNHVYEKEKHDLDKLVPNYFFLINEQGGLSNGSFCGNDIDTRAPVCREYLYRTCKKIIEWFDIDGFRFDLMGILDVDTMNKIAKMAKDKKPDFMIYGEGWNMPSFVPENLRASQNNQAKMPNIGHFSDGFRETVRGSNGDLTGKGYISGNMDKVPYITKSLTAELDRYSSPEKVINYVECHDNHTLWDKNHACCSEESHVVRCKIQVLGNAMVLLAQGVPFLHCGQEYGRTKQNLGNTYNMPDVYNKIDYSRRDEMHRVVDETKQLIQIRRTRTCFRLSTVKEVVHYVKVESMDHKVIVYKCEDLNSKCVTFFNPTDKHYSYNLNEEYKLLFDNGHRNATTLYTAEIAPYSVVVCEKKKE